MFISGLSFIPQQAQPLLEAFPVTGRLVYEAVPEPSSGVALRGARPIRGGSEPPDLPRPTPPDRRQKRMPPAFRKACARPRAAAARRAHAGRPEPTSHDPAAEPETPR